MGYLQSLTGINLKASNSNSDAIKFECSNADERRIVGQLEQIQRSSEIILHASAHTPQGKYELCEKLIPLVQASTLREQEKWNAEAYLRKQMHKAKRTAILRG